MRADSPDVPSIRTWEGCSFHLIYSFNFGALTLIHFWLEKYLNIVGNEVD